MAIDFEKIRQKVAQLSGNRKSDLWSPKPGKEYNVRILPWPDGNDGQPAKEREFYYNIANGRPILAPKQFGKPDPIQELINKLRNEGTPGAMELCKQLYPKKRYYVPVVVRGEEEAGPKLWSFGKQIYQKLLDAMLGDFGDITDVKDGRDVKVVCSQLPGKSFPETDAMPRVAQTPAGSAKQIKEWATMVPKLDEIYTLMTFDEVEKRVNDHINGVDASTSSPSQGNDGAEPFQKKGQKTAGEITMAETADIDDVFSKLDSLADS